MILWLVILPETNQQQGSQASSWHSALVYLYALLGTVQGGGGSGEVRIPGCSLPSKFLKLDARENGVHIGGLTEFHGLKQVNPSNCQIPSLFVSLEGKWSVGLDILRERQVKTLRIGVIFNNYFLRKQPEFLTLFAMTNYKEKCRPACVSCLLSEELYLGVFFAIRGWYELVPT